MTTRVILTCNRCGKKHDVTDLTPAPDTWVAVTYDGLFAGDLCGECAKAFAGFMAGHVDYAVDIHTSGG
jgi:hypothetical protein